MYYYTKHQDEVEIVSELPNEVKNQEDEKVNDENKPEKIINTEESKNDSSNVSQAFSESMSGEECIDSNSQNRPSTGYEISYQNKGREGFVPKIVSKSSEEIER